MEPAAIDVDHWHWRWQYGAADDYEFLHRVAAPFWVGRKAAWKHHRLTTVCGISGMFCMPGVMSRMAALRCPACCKRLKIPEGEGAPWNTKAAWQSA
jgi:hypothetical protein